MTSVCCRSLARLAGPGCLPGGSGGLWLSGEGGGQYDEGTVQANACGAWRAPGEGLESCVDCSAPANRQRLRAEDGCAGLPRGCERWREGGARPPLTPTVKIKVGLGDVERVL